MISDNDKNMHKSLLMNQQIEVNQNTRKFSLHLLVVNLRKLFYCLKEMRHGT